MIRGAPLLALLGAFALGACTRHREIPRQDWPVLAQNSQLTVQTLAGTTYDVNRFLFTTEGLSAWKGNDFSATRSDSVLIPIDSIAVVKLTEPNADATFRVLAAATVAGFAILMQSKSNVRPAPVPRPPSSCPFLYSFDGKDYVFDSESYAGAVARGLERSDVDNLEHLRPVAGTYRLRMKNERPETDYTDEVNLLVVDHPPGTRAVPRASGHVALIGVGMQPAATRPYGGDTIPSRAGWELAFPRPDGDTAALVLQVRNTMVGPFALYHTLGLLGSDVYAWYAAIRSQPLTRAVVRSWVEREGYLDVQAGDAGIWRTLERLPDVGAAIAKAQVVLVDLTKVRGDTVRLRAESSPGLWLLERAELAPYLGPARSQTIQPRRVIDDGGGDVAPLLRERDAKYFVTTMGSDVELLFDAPPVPADVGLRRSVLVRTTGYYYVETDDRKTPRRDIVERLMRDRAFAQRYFTDAWIQAGGEPLTKPR